MSCLPILDPKDVFQLVKLTVFEVSIHYGHKIASTLKETDRRTFLIGVAVLVAAPVICCGVAYMAKSAAAVVAGVAIYYAIKYIAQKCMNREGCSQPT